MNQRIAGLALATSLAVSPVAITTSAEASTPTLSSGQKILKQGAKYKGVRYRYGGTSPKSGFDCSGLTQYTLKRLGKKIPRVASAQYRSSKHIKSPRAGDLGFVYNSRGVYHTFIYVNSKTWLEAERPGHGVNYYKPWSKKVHYGRYTVK